MLSAPKRVLGHICKVPENTDSKKTWSSQEHSGVIHCNSGEATEGSMDGVDMLDEHNGIQSAL